MESLIGALSSNLNSKDSGGEKKLHHMGRNSAAFVQKFEWGKTMKWVIENSSTRKKRGTYQWGGK